MGRCGSLVFVHPLYATIETCSDPTIVVTTYLGVIISDDALASAERRTGRGDASTLLEICGPQYSTHPPTKPLYWRRRRRHLVSEAVPVPWDFDLQPGDYSPA